MAEIELDGADELSANTELRIIALELMKISSKRKKPFAEVADEYIRNVYLLKQMLDTRKE
jgi:hypothetical protein